ANGNAMAKVFANSSGVPKSFTAFSDPFRSRNFPIAASAKTPKSTSRMRSNNSFILSSARSLLHFMFFLQPDRRREEPERVSQSIFNITQIRKVQSGFGSARCEKYE